MYIIIYIYIVKGIIYVNIKFSDDKEVIFIIIIINCNFFLIYYLLYTYIFTYIFFNIAP